MEKDARIPEKESYAYYKCVLETGEHIAYLMYGNGTFISAGGVSFCQVMPTYHNPTSQNALGATQLVYCIIYFQLNGAE